VKRLDYRWVFLPRLYADRDSVDKYVYLTCFICRLLARVKAVDFGCVGWVLYKLEVENVE
jgi:hypothetical protein